MNQGCPNCDGLLIQKFDSDGLLKLECTHCKYTQYLNNGEGTNNYKNQNWIINVFNKTRQDIIQNKNKLIVVSYLKTIREKRGISQKQIAEIFGFTEQRYGNVERHYNAPSVVLISQFAHVLNVPIGELYKSVQITQDLYDEMKYLKIEKSELVQDEELKNVDIQLKKSKLELENVYNKISEQYENESKEFIKSLPQYKAAYKEYSKNKILYDKLFNSTSIFLKQGELVEDTYWNKFLEYKGLDKDLNLINK